MPRWVRAELPQRYDWIFTQGVREPKTEANYSWERLVGVVWLMDRDGNEEGQEWGGHQREKGNLTDAGWGHEQLEGKLKT